MNEMTGLEPPFGGHRNGFQFLKSIEKLLWIHSGLSMVRYTIPVINTSSYLVVSISASVAREAWEFIAYEKAGQSYVEIRLSREEEKCIVCSITD